MQTVPPVNVRVPVAGGSAPFVHTWKTCMGSGHAALGTRVDWRAHLSTAVSELGLRGVRMHGWLDDDMSVAPTASPPFNFYNIDVVADFLVSLDVACVFELDYMPKALAACKDTCTYAFGDRGGYKGLLEAPSNYSLWHTLVRDTAQHLVDRHGLAALRAWRFEVWNEPQAFLGGMGYPSAYLPLYNASATALRAVAPELRVGGPATAALAHLTHFVSWATAHDVPLDFVSSHSYPSDSACSQSGGAGAANSELDCFVAVVLNASSAVSAMRRAGTGVPPLPLLLTEYNSGLQGGPGTGHSGRHADTAYAAAFAVRVAPRLTALELASWWSFSDVFEEGWLTGRPFYGGFGLLTTHGVRKPAYRAFELLGGAGAHRLTGVTISDPAPDYADASTVSVLATVDGADEAAGDALRGLQIFVSNFGPEAGATASPWVPKARNVSVSIVLPLAVERSESGTTPVHACASFGGPLATSGGGGDRVPTQAVLRRIDDTVTNPYARWIAMGSPAYPTPGQVAELHDASHVPTKTVALAHQRIDGEAVGVAPTVPPHGPATSSSLCCSLEVTIEVPAYGVAHLSLFA